MLDSDMLTVLGRLAAAFAVGLPAGWDRERRAGSAGLRTFPLVALGSCAFLLIGQQAFRDDSRAQAYVFQAVLSGIGFIGGGAIIKGNGEVQGIVTAVSIWITAAAGTAIAYGYYLLAVMLSLTTLLALQMLRPLKKT